MMFTPEMIQKAKAAANPEELLKIAHENNVDMTADAAKEMYSELHAEGSLSDDELNNVAGGGCSDSPNECPDCGSTNVHYEVSVEGNSTRLKTFYKCHCNDCGTNWRAKHRIEPTTF